MTVVQAIRASLSLLTSRDRRRLALITVAQMSTSVLDLVGVLLIGLVTALSLSIMSSAPPPVMVESVLKFLGISNDDPVTVALTLATVAGFLLILKSVVSMLLTRRILRFLANRQALVSSRLAAGLLSRPLLQVQEQSSQQTVYTLTGGVSAATLTILTQATIALTETTLLVVLALGVFALSPVVTVFAIGFFLVISFALQRVIAGKAGIRGQRAAHMEVQSIRIIQEALRTYREAVVSQRRGLYVLRFQDLCRQLAINTTDIQFAAMIPKYILEIALVFGAGILALSQLLTKDLVSAVAIIAVFLAAGSRIIPSLLRLQGASIGIRTAAGMAAPTYKLARELDLECLTPAVDSLGCIDPVTIRANLEKGYDGFDGSISISDIDLLYPGTNSPALTAVSLHLPAGKSLAIVGPTGAGKSTLTDVILGVIIPDSGVALIGGLTPAEALATWPGAVAYVPQDVAMTQGTVRENVALGLPVEIIDDDWVWDALNRAHLGEFLQSFRQGIDTVIGENGVMLSGGQRQRLGIARALYTRPKLLVLDEATSALDAETEQAIAQTLQELEDTVTTVTIAHRLATIRHCDLVIYLDGGRSQAQGSFSEVRAIAPEFDRQAQLLGL